MIILRSLLCNVVLLLWLILCGFGGLPTLLLREPPQGALAVMRFWAHGAFVIIRVCCGVRMKVEGEPPCGRVIVASKHESAWETIVMHTLLNKPCIILKRELHWIPIIGWYIWALQSIAIDRKAGRKALDKIVQQSVPKLEQGRQVVIFPEGTRVKHGEKSKYHSGVAAVYEACGVPVVPVALNSGKCWPKNSWKKYPGTITIRFLEPIAPGLPRDEFMTLLEARIEDAQKTL